MTLSLALFVALVVLQFLDYMTTTHILAAGGRELNPVMQWLFDRLGTEQALLTKGFVVILAGGLCRLYDNTLALGIIVAVYVAVIAWNLYQIAKAPK